MAVVNTNELLGLNSAYGNRRDPNDPVGKSELGKEDFLTLLVVQLQNQDPLNPMDDTQFTSQLAEFSSLEQLTNINKGVESLNGGSERDQMITAVNFIGKEVRASGDMIGKSNSGVSTLFFELDEPIATGFVNFFDKAGGIVNTIQLGAMQAGQYEITWDGKDYNGNNVPNGVYYVSMACEDHNGKPVLVDTDVSGKVVGVQKEDGLFFLRLQDGRLVEFSSIKEVVNPSTQNANPDQDDDSESDDGESDTDA
ncbi:flagellar hook assembly protein FlgD [Oceanidesulfovibrio indonesiensis]|uniref:Basal-body rod modification protein FlgD n=1 Tax=Oceanidesulfovibrio indonesiensis TaxID=54767 RepID=A0A7M3MJ26_9BACT|nr:flagellar hook capping FlgD N-terminal domain-containing protein [Oceanidesulfovibrio indonesiensis]TVM19794.1 flagellar hook assembly protein FlgD [Oceanidesulfovibrio indonesiensis]